MTERDWDAFDKYLFGVPRLVYWKDIGRIDPEAQFQWEQMIIDLAADPKLDRTDARRITEMLPKELTLIWHRDKGFVIQ